MSDWSYMILCPQKIDWICSINGDFIILLKKYFGRYCFAKAAVLYRFWLQEGIDKHRNRFDVYCFSMISKCVLALCCLMMGDPLFGLGIPRPKFQKLFWKPIWLYWYLITVLFFCHQSILIRKRKTSKLHFSIKNMKISMQYNGIFL